MVISMERPKILFVFNPRSGKAKIKNKLCDIIDIFVKAGYEVTVYPTQEEGDAIRAVRDKREDYALLVCSGGDGTLDEVVNGMIKCGKHRILRRSVYEKGGGDDCERKGLCL